MQTIKIEFPESNDKSRFAWLVNAIAVIIETAFPSKTYKMEFHDSTIPDAELTKAANSEIQEWAMDAWTDGSYDEETA